MGALLGLLLAVGAFALLNGDNVGGLFGGDVSPTGPAGTAPPDEPTAEVPTPGPAAPDGSFRCEAQMVRAPEFGTWQLFRASFGTRQAFDYLTLHLRQTGRANDSARIRAELIAPGDVPGRYGVDAPPGDTTLVISLDGPVRIPGSFGGRPGHQALQQFEVVRGDDGAVHVVAGISGSGCFAMLAEDWQAGSTPRTTEVTFRIERP
jgi:hypothetical protein